MSSKENRKSRHSVPATVPGAVSLPFEEVRMEEPAPLLATTTRPKSSRDTMTTDASAKRTESNSSQATIPGVTMMNTEKPQMEALSMEPRFPKKSRVSKNGKERKPKRKTSVTTTKAATMEHDDTVMEPEGVVTTGSLRKVSRGPQPEPDLISEPMNQHGKTRGRAASTPGVVHVESQNTTTSTVAYGSSKPARVSHGEVMAPGALSVQVFEGFENSNSNVQVQTSRTVSRDASSKGKASTPDSMRPGAQAMSGTEMGEQDTAERRKDPRANVRRNDSAKKSKESTQPNEAAAVVAGTSSAQNEKERSTDYDAYKKRMEDKILEMENKMATSSESEPEQDLYGKRRRDEDKKGIIKSHNENKPVMDLVPPEEAPSSGYMITPYADRGIAGAPDLVHGSTLAGYGGAGFGGYGNVTDEGLAIALAIEEEEDLFFPAAIEYDPDAKPSILKNRRFRVYTFGGVFLLIVILVGGIVGIFAGKGKGSNTYPPTESPTFSPSTSREGTYREQFEKIVGETALPEGTTQGPYQVTPHEMAATWITSLDPLNLPADSPNLIQRYLLVLFYFMTTDNGKRPWRSCNPPIGEEGATCIFQKYQRESDDTETYVNETKTRWLSGTHECSWVGIECDDAFITRVIDLWWQNITGPLPTEVSLFTYLQSIALPKNDFTGTIPTQWASMRHLINLEVHYNSLTGTIPKEFWAANALQNLNVGGNFLTGTLSTEVGLLTNLKGLHTFQNQLTGNFPSEIGNLEFLSFTYHQNNRFDGSIPSEIGKLGIAQELWLSENNFTGKVPSNVGAMVAISDLRLSGNPLTGTIPDELYSLPSLARLDLYDTMITGTISTSISQLTKLSDLRLRRTMLSGTIPTQLGLVKSLRLAWLHLTELSGSMPSEICANTGEDRLVVLQADCESTSAAPAVECTCCTSCCDRVTKECFILN